jgi:hypothetical protein
MTYIVVVLVLISDELIRELVERIISEMHIWVLLRINVVIILISGKAR